MAKKRIDVNFYRNTLEENEAILSKLRACGKIDNKTPEDWNKVFSQLNSNNGWKYSKNAKSSSAGRKDQAVLEPVYGPIPGFPSGSWWGIRMDCSRDRVHSPFDKDIQQGPFVVASICTSQQNANNDVDLGTFLTYTGGEYVSQQSRDPLIQNLKNHIPLRVVRSYNLANKFAPKTGYRYDGLYIVASTWIGTSSNGRKYHKYALARLNCQDPPPWSLPSRASRRLSTAVKNSNLKTGCGSIRCHMYGCQTQEPDKKKRKIILERSPPANKTVHKPSDIQRNIQESTIVMRHVSKKIDGPMGHGINNAESPVQIGNIVLGCSPKPPTCKLQNTNISIRTELYDSSPNQQDSKKSTPMTFCRIYKSNRTPARIMSNTVGTMNLNTFGPCSDDKVQESQIQSRSGVCKVSEQSPILTTTSNGDSSGKDPCSFKSSSNTPNINDIPETNPTPKSSHVINPAEFTNTESKDRPKNQGKRQEIPEKSIEEAFNASKRAGSYSRRGSETSLSSTESLTKKLHLPEAVVAIESMTPEQMLNLIVKKRYNPTGKLLIGSIIGLPAEDPTLTPQNDVENPSEPMKDQDQDHCNSPVPAPIAQTTTKPNTKQKTNDKINFYQSRSKSAPMTKIRNENKDRGMKMMRLKRSRVAKGLAELEESNINRNKSSTKLLNKPLTSKKIVQPFSKSTVPKKRRSELANLAIDANFVTNYRGEMIQTRTMSSRKLRGPTIILNKRKEFSGFITNYTRFDLAKKSKRLTGTTKSRIPKTLHVQQAKKNSNEAVNNKTPPKSINKEDKRKNSTSKIIEKPSKSTATEPKKPEQSKSQMVDAETQCCLQKDASTSIDTEMQIRAPIRKVKIEWIDLVDDDDDDNIKSESGESGNESEREIIYQESEAQTSEDTELLGADWTQRQTKTVSDNEQGLSAFVPVSLSEGDFRVARLRSIGFKPIEPCALHAHDASNCFNNCEASGSSKSTVIRRDVDEQYNKYTSEENNVVGYMDHELHFQDIEEEAVAAQKVTGIICKHKYTKVQEKVVNKKATSEKRQGQRKKRKYSSSSVEDEEVPWHGWNTVVKNR